MIPSTLLQDKKILLGVTGSISAYKALDLLRLFIKAGATVKVVMSEASTRFVSPLSFEALSSQKVLLDGNECWSSGHNHIGAIEESDIFVIAPSSANTIAKLANGIADNILLQCALADDRVKIIAPAANTKMLQNHIIQGSLKMLKVSGYEVVPTQIKELACKSVGDGALAEPIDIFYATAKMLLQDPFWVNRRAIVTGGGTIERVDDVRFIGNFSSGKMASSLATALYLRGAEVLYITTKSALDLPLFVKTLTVESSDELQSYLTDAVRFAQKPIKTKATLMDSSAIESISKEPYLFMAAAVSDYVVKSPTSGKIKKESTADKWSLELAQRSDIIGSLDKSNIKTVAFKAETDKTKALQSAKEALLAKNVDFISLNIISKSNPFGSDTNSITLISSTQTKELKKALKLPLSLELLDSVKI